jgi:phosphoribosylglycinamide formyltransferase-1
MDLKVHEAVLAAGETETGCTVHVVTAGVDTGPIILQKKCAVLATDTPESLKQKVQVVRCRFYS